MASWTGDGLIAGYDPITKRLKADLYHLATPGSVDLQGITRLQNTMGAGLSTSLYPNKFQGKAPMSLVSADFTANPGKQLGPVMAIAPAAFFPENYVPKPSEILALGDGKAVARVPDLIYTSPVSRTWTFQERNEYWDPNQKFWILMYVAAFAPGVPISKWSDLPPMKGVSVDTIGRAVSIWTNRTPGKPVITAPPDGSITLPGATFDLAYNPTDPDEVAPQDAAKFNDDIIGVQIQVAPVPTLDNPNPTWADMSVALSDVELDGCWIIKGARGSETLRLDALPPIVDNLGMTIRCGGTDRDWVPGRGELPTGDWQIRLRTFDYGHPYPNDGSDISMPGPEGFNQSAFVVPYPAKDNYNSPNVSPWSDPIKVSVPTQVPAPLPLSPKDEVAVSGNLPVRLSWKYRNTHQPPRDQYQRQVQIRKVGDPDWATVFNGSSSDAFVDLPPIITQPPIPPLSLLSDGNFEGGTTDVWAAPAGYEYLSVTNVNDPAKAHSGSRSLIVTNPGTGTYYDSYVWMSYEPTPEDSDRLTVTVDGWIWLPDASKHPALLMQGVWRDAEGNIIADSSTGLVFDSPFMLYFSTDELATGVGGWFKLSELPTSTYGGYDLDDLSCQRPAAGLRFELAINVVNNVAGTFDPAGLISEMRLDDFTVEFSGVDLDDFSLSATNQYEWRVQVTDTDVLTSDYSTPARFWVVPDAASGDVRPVPSGTIEGATLGCGTHRAFIYRRGGKRRVGELSNLSHVDWSRVRDDISTAKVVVSDWDVDCGKLLADLQTWAYELVIVRDNGYSKDRVWEGPITLLTYETDAVTIEAKDVMGYAYRRIIKQQMTDSGSGHGTTVVDRARRVLQNVFAPDDPNVLAYLQVLARDDDAMQYRSTPAYSRTAFEEVDDMAANAGLDYTTVGRSILLWGTKHRIGTLPEFKDENLGSSPIVSEYGMSMANRYAVSDGNGVWGEATRLDDSGNDETYGLVEMLSSTWASDSEDQSGTYTQEGLQTVIESFESFAERSIADRYPPPVVVRVPDNTTLNPNTVISIQHLVPGIVVPLRSSGTLRTVVASQKLDSVTVTEESGKETVSITLSPFSRDDASVSDEGDGT